MICKRLAQNSMRRGMLRSSTEPQGLKMFQKVGRLRLEDGENEGAVHILEHALHIGEAASPVSNDRSIMSKSLRPAHGSQHLRLIVEKHGQRRLRSHLNSDRS